MNCPFCDSKQVIKNNLNQRKDFKHKVKRGAIRNMIRKPKYAHVCLSCFTGFNMEE